MSLSILSQCDEGWLRKKLLVCCSSPRWVEAVMARFPFPSSADVHAVAAEEWVKMGNEDVLQAISSHPRIGEQALKAKFGDQAGWAAGEQAGTKGASEAVLTELAAHNESYSAKFGFTFLICATGKSADFMLDCIKRREGNSKEEELKVAAVEQGKITAIRLDKLAAEVKEMRPPLTTHVLDTASGLPARGCPITLEVMDEEQEQGQGSAKRRKGAQGALGAGQGKWKRLGSAVTNDDGRVDVSLVPLGRRLQRATYRATFDTGAYFELHGQRGFYPYAQVVFQVTDPASHHHIPLLLSPFGYSTYRGS